jgi:hypothetical protein
MLTHIVIIDGKLCQGTLDFELQSDDMSADQLKKLNWRGDVIFDNGRFRIIQGVTAYDFTVGKATQESIDYTSGYEHGKSQKIKRLPKNYPSSNWFYGWAEAWKEKGK